MPKIKMFLTVLMLGVATQNPSHAVDTTLETARPVARNIREINRMLPMRKKVTPTIIQNLTQIPVSVSITCCCYDPEPGEPGSRFMMIIEDTFEQIKVTSFDDNGFPQYSKKGQNVITTVGASPTEDSAVWMIRDYDLPANQGPTTQGNVKIVPYVKKDLKILGYLSRIKLNTPGVFLNRTVMGNDFVLTVTEAFTPLTRSLPDTFDFSGIDVTTDSTLTYFKSVVATAEGFDPAAFTSKLNTLFAEYAQRTNTQPPTTAPRNPLNMHSFLPDGSDLETYCKRLKTSMESCRPDDGWNHIVWVVEKSSADSVNEQLHALGVNSTWSVTINEVQELTPSFPALLRSSLQSELKQLIDAHNTNDLSLLLRFLTLNRDGGVYRGATVEVLQDLAPSHMTAEFYTGQDIVSHYFTTDNVVAAIPGHPIITTGLSLIARNVAAATRPSYLKGVPANVDASALKYGSGLMAIAIMQASRAGVDFVERPFVFCPMIPENADTFTHQKIQLSPEAMAIDYDLRYQITPR